MSRLTSDSVKVNGLKVRELRMLGSLLQGKLADGVCSAAYIGAIEKSPEISVGRTIALGIANNLSVDLEEILVSVPVGSLEEAQFAGAEEDSEVVQVGDDAMLQVWSDAAQGLATSLGLSLNVEELLARSNEPDSESLRQRYRTEIMGVLRHFRNLELVLEALIDELE